MSLNPPAAIILNYWDYFQSNQITSHYDLSTTSITCFTHPTTMTMSVEVSLFCTRAPPPPLYFLLLWIPRWRQRRERGHDGRSAQDGVRQRFKEGQHLGSQLFSAVKALRPRAAAGSPEGRVLPLYSNINNSVKMSYDESVSPVDSPLDSSCRGPLLMATITCVRIQ